MKIGLAFNLRKDYVARPGDPPDAAAEFDSEGTIGFLEEAIASWGYATVRLGGGEAFLDKVRREKPDLVFNIAEGMAGRSREAQIPAVLELLGIPYTGSDPLTMAVCLDKEITKRILAFENLPLARGMRVVRLGDLAGLDWPYPLFVKPVHEGTAKGITPENRVYSPDNLHKKVAELLRAYRQPVLVEEFLPGAEYTVGLVGNQDPQVLGIMEVAVTAPEEQGIYSLRAKEECESLVKYTKAVLPAPLAERIEAVSIQAFKALGCRDAARLDIKLDAAGEPRILEMNPLAGMHPTHSDLPMIADQAGLGYKGLVGAILHHAMARYNLEPRPVL
jgi:D-alanine-D-alanine ligase